MPTNHREKRVFIIYHKLIIYVFQLIPVGKLFFLPTKNEKLSLYWPAEGDLSLFGNCVNVRWSFYTPA